MAIVRAQPACKRSTSSASSLTCSTRSGSSVTSTADSGGLQQLGVLTVPVSGFDAASHAAELVRLLAPGRSLPQPTVRAVGVTAGVWILSAGPGSSDSWCLKQVSAQRRLPALPTDAEHCEALLRRFPGLLADQRLAFPHSILRLQAEGEHVSDVLVSRAMPGVQLAQYIAKLDRSSSSDQRKLEAVCQEVGAALADFHSRYADPETGEATHHRDFHPSNVLYHEATGAISFVDLCGMGTWGPNDDVEKFARLVKQLAGERYEAAFSGRYSVVAQARGLPVGRSPSAVGTKRRPLYAGTCSSDSGELDEGFRHLNILLVPSSGFEPAAHLTTLSWLIAPGRALPQPSVRKAGFGGKLWVLSAGGPEPSEAWALKQVGVRRRGPGAPTEAEHCEALARRFPGLLQDTRLAFPRGVLPLQTGCEHSGDILVSRALPGEPLSTYMARLDSCSAKDQRKLEKICKEVGSLLADFHTKYADPVSGEATHHRAFHPGHVLYDEASGALGVIEFSDMGTPGPRDDAERFAGVMEKWAGERYTVSFLQSYAANMAGHGKAVNLHLPSSSPSWWFCGTGQDSDSEDEGNMSSESEAEALPEQQCSMM